ncbi:hypothetical protein BGP75_10950 [Motiliproteus sp. MSK22-1]|nr:hypothetical protein BGP75_10950 [Motiliproteus sp. MSK22-1]
MAEGHVPLHAIVIKRHHPLSDSIVSEGIDALIVRLDYFDLAYFSFHAFSNAFIESFNGYSF